MTSPLPEPATESLGAAIIELDRARLPWPARWVLRDGTRARFVIADQVARRVEARVVARVREETTEQIKASWFKALNEQAEPEPLPPFNSVAQCRKCLTELSDPGFRAARWCGGTLDGSRSHLPEAMKRTCSKCGYWWMEAPADAPEAQSGPQSDETGSGGAAVAETHSGALSTPQETGTGPCAPTRAGDAYSATETPVAARTAEEALNDESGARGASTGREEASAVGTVADGFR